MSDITEWITAISSVIAASGVGIVAYQAWLAKSSLKQGAASLDQAAKSIELARLAIVTDHERSRRENAAELIMIWSKSLKQEQSIARKLVETFSVEDTKKLHQRHAFSIDKKYATPLSTCLTNCEDSNIVNNDGKIKLSEKQSAYLCWLIISYLNLLESILSYWLHGIADEEMLKSEFKYMVNSDKQRFILHKYRTVNEGVNNHPSIDAFVNMLKNEHKKNIQPREPIA